MNKEQAPAITEKPREVAYY